LIPIFAGWASNNKYSFIGAFRVAYMYISAEIPLVLCGAAVAIMAGSFDLVKIVQAQQNMWFAVPQFIGFMIFFLGVIIESERTPFDIPVPVLGFLGVTGSHIFWMLTKFVFMTVLIIFIRCVYPRLRLDQMLDMGWKYLTPLAVLNLALVLGMKMMGVY
jgi:NADH-quinone oxidoreductase subunit H